MLPGEADDPEVNDLLRETADWYGDAAFFGAMAHRPALLEGFVALFETVAERGSFDPELLELARLRVAAVHQCAYCATVRTREVAHAVAPREAAVLGEEIDPAPLAEREALAVRFADLMSRDPQRITDDFFADLRGAFTDAEIVELGLFLALEVGLDRFCIALRLDTTGDGPYPTGLSYPFDRGDHERTSADE